MKNKERELGITGWNENENEDYCTKLHLNS